MMLLLASGLGFSSVSAMTLVEEGQPRATIVAGPSDQAQGAAQELQHFLQRMSGATLPLKTDGDPVDGPRILVGHSSTVEGMDLNVPTGITKDLDEEGLVIFCRDDTLVLAGNETPPYAGTYFAVSQFLELLGCRWFFPGDFGEVIPRQNTIRVEEMEVRRKPAMRIRHLWYSGHVRVNEQQGKEFALWSRRNKLNNAAWSVPSDDTTYRLLPKGKYWDTHPEFYAMRKDGSRNERMPCMTEPGAIQAAADTICEAFAQDPQMACFSFSPPDEPVACYTPGCLEAVHGGYGGEGWGPISDAWFSFVAQVAERVYQRFPDRRLHTMAYYNRVRPPEGVDRFPPNVIMQIADIQDCDLHSFGTDWCPTRSRFLQIMRRWAPKVGGIVTYEYDPHDWYDHVHDPTWRQQRLAEDYRAKAELNYWGFCIEAHMNYLCTGINFYTRARLAWDVHTDPEALLTDFCEKFFGPAAQPMQRYYESMEEAPRQSRMHNPRPEEFREVFSSPVLRQAEVDLKAAEEAAQEEPYRTRVFMFRQGFQRILSYVMAHESAARGDYQAAVDWAREMRAAVERVNDSMLLVDGGPYSGGMVSDKEEQFYQQLLDRTANGQQMALFPQVCLFRTDPTLRGTIWQWYRPDLNESHWQPLRTDASWNTQGITDAEGDRYSGIAWYRAEVTVPPGQTEATVRLLLPEVRADEVWAWVNGRFAGYAHRQGGWEFEVAPPLQEGKNLVVLRVNGDGGLMLPPLLLRPR